jgi:hypothetical protein
MKISRIIIEQINSIDKWALGAYGSTNFYHIPETPEFSGGLMFSVNGLVHKGKVKILLTWMDEYKIIFLNQKGVSIKEVNGVYCDMLVQVLDYIEYGDK